ncbi:outer membrane porin GjpA [Mycolicibacterium pulveris]|uniref:outer membrane porin GjpA n=1 Tax=Mycolicibacterium pulveris TaxID=36813 RepID=UPI003CE93A3E
MPVTLRPYTSAGLALVSATAIAMTPVVAAPSLPDVKVANPAVQLSAAVNPIAPWLEVWEKSETNLANLADTWLEAPAPILQQVIANQLGYLQQLPDFPVILEEMVGNLRAAIQAPFATDTSTLENTTPLMNHRSLFTILSDLAAEGAGPIPAELMPLVNFSTTFTSGMLLGLVGPVISPVLALVASAGAIVENLTGETPDLEAAFNTLINTPAAMVDAFLNGGQTLDLTPVLDALGINLDPAPGTEVQTVGITFGGLLSPGGSMFNALDFGIVIGGRINVPVAGQGPGFIGSLIGLTQTIAKAIGWDGEGNPLAPSPDEPAEPAPESANVDDPGQVPASVLASQTVTLPTAQDNVLDGAATEVEAASLSEEPTGSVTEEDVTEEEATEEEVTEDDLETDLLEQEDEEPTGNQHGVVRTNGPDNGTADDAESADEPSGSDSTGSDNASDSEADGDNGDADSDSSDSSEGSSGSDE